MTLLLPAVQAAREVATSAVSSEPANPPRTLLETLADELGAAEQSLAAVYDSAFVDTSDRDGVAGPFRPVPRDGWFDL